MNMKIEPTVNFVLLKPTRVVTPSCLVAVHSFLKSKTAVTFYNKIEPLTSISQALEFEH